MNTIQWGYGNNYFGINPNHL